MPKSNGLIGRIDEPLDMLVAGGALGLISYLLIFVAAIYLLWKKRNVLGITDAALLVGLLAGYFFQGLFVFDNLISYIFFYTVLAYIHSRDIESIVPAQPVKNNPTAKNLPKQKNNEEMANYVGAADSYRCFVHISLVCEYPAD